MKKLVLVMVLALLAACGAPPSPSTLVGTWYGTSGSLGIKLQINGGSGTAYYDTGGGFYYGGPLTTQQIGERLIVINLLYDGSGQLEFDGIVDRKNYSGTLVAVDSAGTVVATNRFDLYRD